MPIVQCLPSGPLQTNTYLLVSEQMAVLLDPAIGCKEQVISMCDQKKWTLQAIWITHSHWDHVAGIQSILEHKQVPVCVHVLDAENLERPGSDGVPTWLKIPAVHPDRLLKNKDILSVGSSVWEVLHTPGHSPGSCCFFDATDGLLFSGDTLFVGTCGNVSFPTSSPQLMADSLERLLLLPPKTTVYPGHGPETTVGKEKEWMEAIIASWRSSGDCDGC